MSRRSLVVGIGVVLVLSVSIAQAQRREQGDEKDAPDAPAAGDPGPGPGHDAPPPHPLMQALDTDGDGILSKKEIGAATKSLRKLDANRDGRLTPDELTPAGPPPGMGMGGNGGPAQGFGAPGAAPGAAGGAAGNSGFGGAAGTFGGAGGAGGFARPGGNGLSQTNQLMGFDQNKDGQVSREELPQRMHVLFDRLDLDRNGNIDIRELRAAAARGGR